MSDKNKNQSNNNNQQGDNKPNAKIENEPKHFENLSKEGGINNIPNKPNKGGRFGNASVEDGGDVEGSSAGS